MCLKRCGRKPHPVRRGIARAGALGLLVALTGCANERGASYSSAPTASPPMQMAGVRVEIEADGLPAQIAPRDHAPITDDPREPWSPNYGTVRPEKTTATEAPAVVAMATPQPVSMIRSTPIDAEDIIRRAVAAHEMRQGDRE